MIHYFCIFVMIFVFTTTNGVKKGQNLLTSAQTAAHFHIEACEQMIDDVMFEFARLRSTHAQTEF